MLEGWWWQKRMFPHLLSSLPYPYAYAYIGFSEMDLFFSSTVCVICIIVIMIRSTYCRIVILQYQWTSHLQNIKIPLIWIHDISIFNTNIWYRIRKRGTNLHRIFLYQVNPLLFWREKKTLMCQIGRIGVTQKRHFFAGDEQIVIKLIVSLNLYGD